MKDRERKALLAILKSMEAKENGEPEKAEGVATDFVRQQYELAKLYGLAG